MLNFGASKPRVRGGPGPPGPPPLDPHLKALAVWIEMWSKITEIDSNCASDVHLLAITPLPTPTPRDTRKIILWTSDLTTSNHAQSDLLMENFAENSDVYQVTISFVQ